MIRSCYHSMRNTTKSILWLLHDFIHPEGNCCAAFAVQSSKCANIVKIWNIIMVQTTQAAYWSPTGSWSILSSLNNSLKRNQIQFTVSARERSSKPSRLSSCNKWLLSYCTERDETGWQFLKQLHILLLSTAWWIFCFSLWTQYFLDLWRAAISVLVGFH